MATSHLTNKQQKNHQGKIKGQLIEDKASRWLEEQGLTLLQRNYRCKLGEIDIIMLDGQQLVFIEVRFRNSNNFGSAAESVNWHKQKKLLKAAGYFLLINKKYRHLICRFDVIAAQPMQNQNKINYQWIKNAFTA